MDGAWGAGLAGLVRSAGGAKKLAAWRRRIHLVFGCGRWCLFQGTGIRIRVWTTDRERQLLGREAALRIMSDCSMRVLAVYGWGSAGVYAVDVPG
jgi:hypothetical protein